MDHYRIAWNPTLSIGDSTIDAQHKHLVDLIGQISEGRDAQDALTLNAALEYAAVHFKAEEEVMRRCGFPGLQAHVAQHKFLTRTLVAYVKKVEKGETDLYAFKNFMFTWVRDHIMDEDQKIGLFLRQQQAPPHG
jgi:hemerythrin-like metal-binding protein